jgi:hypothetical protein
MAALNKLNVGLDVIIDENMEAEKVFAPSNSRYRKMKSTVYDETQEEHDDIEEITFFDDTQDDQQMNNSDIEDMDTSEANNTDIDTTHHMNEFTKTYTPEDSNKKDKKMNQDRHHMNEFKSHSPADNKQKYKKQYFTAAIKMPTVGLEVNVAARLRWFWTI